MANGHLTDAGGLILVDIALGDTSKFANLTLRAFTDSGALQDGQAARSFVTPGDAGYAVVDLLALASASSLVGGVPTIEWDDVVWTFTGPLTGGATIKGVAIVGGSTQIYEQLLPGSGFTPANNGDKLTVTPLVMFGNVPGGGLPV